MKKLRKKNTRLARQERIARAVTKDRYIIFVGKEKVALFNPKTKQIFGATKNQIAAYGEYRHKWSIAVAILCRKDNERYIKVKQIDCPIPYTCMEISEIVTKEHGALIDECNASHFVNVGWLGATHYVDFDEAQLLEWFELAGGYQHTIELDRDYKSKLESAA